MALTLLQPLQVPRPPRAEDLRDPKAAVEGLGRWAASLSSVLNTFIQQVQEVGEAFITSPSSANLDTGVIQGYQLIVTSALITVAAQIQDATITNAKIVSLVSQKIYLGNDLTGNTLTSAGSTLILPGLLQISSPDSGANSLYVRGVADGTQDASSRSLRINGVEQYPGVQQTIQGIAFNTVNTAGVAGAVTVYETNHVDGDVGSLANAILTANASALIVLSSYQQPGSAAFSFTTGTQNAKNLGSALLAMGLDIGSLEGILVTGGNNIGGTLYHGRIPFVGLGFNGGGAGSGITVYTNGSTNAGAAIYQGFLLGNKPGTGAQFSKTTIIEGGSIRTGTITADRLTVSQLSAIAADMGTLNAGTINGGKIISGATSGAHTKMGPSGVQVFDAAGNVVASLSSATNSLTISSGGNIALQAVSGVPAEFIFQDSNGASFIKITGQGPSPKALSLVPVTTATGTLQLGTIPRRWDGVTVYVGTAGFLVNGTNVGALKYDSAGLLVQVQNAGGIVRSIQYDANSFRPSLDNQQTLGDGTNARWLAVFLDSGSINTIGGATQSSAIVGAVQGSLSVIVDGVERRVPFYAQG